MNTFTIGEIVYQFGINENTFVITVINRLIVEEYSIQIENNSQIFVNHPIIKNIEILETILKDGFNNKPNVVLKFDSNDTVRLVNVVSYGIIIEVDAIYIKDSLTLKLSLIDKHITPKQVTEHIEYRFQQYIPEVKEVISEIKENLQKKLDNLDTRERRDISSITQLIDTDHKSSERVLKLIEKYDVILSEQQKAIQSITKSYEKLHDEFSEHKKTIQSMTKSYEKLQNEFSDQKKTNQSITQSSEKLQNEFIEYVESNPIMRYHNHQNGRCGCVMNNINEIRICDNKFSDQEWVLDDLHISKFKYFKNLEKIEFRNCDFERLDFLAITTKLKSINLINMLKLTTVEYLTNFPNLEQISISRVCNVKDLHTLVKCANLKELKLAKGTNTGCFQQVINFKITME